MDVQGSELGFVEAFGADLLDFAVDVISVSMKASSHMAIIVESVLAPVSTVDPIKDLIDIGLGMV